MIISRKKYFNLLLFFSSLRNILHLWKFGQNEVVWLFDVLKTYCADALFCDDLYYIVCFH